MENLINKIVFGDCLEVMQQIPNESIDLILTDPPYQFNNKDMQGGGFYKKENKKHLEKIQNTFGTTFDPTFFLEIIKQKLKKFNLLVWTNKNLIENYLRFAKENNYSFDIFLWLKNNPVPAFNNHLLIDKEYCIIIREKEAYFNNNLKYNDYFSYFIYSIGNNETKHPTEKPISIFKKLINIYSKENDLILDCFSGSGTTALACHDLKRNFICIEKDLDYWKASNERLNNFTKQLTFNF